MRLFGGVVSITGITFFMFAVFAVIAIGFALGRITVKGISLGDAGVFIVALVFGCIFYDTLAAQLTIGSVNYTSNALKIVENLGLILFVTSVGFTAGPKFFGDFKRNFKSYVALAVVVILAGGLTAIGCIYFGRAFIGVENNDEFTAMIVGILAGALTSTPAFSASKEAVGEGMESAVSTGYGIAYIFGVIGVVLFVQLVPKILRANMDLEREKLTAPSATREKKAGKNEDGRFFEIDGHGIAAFAIAAVVGTFVGMIKIPLTSAGLDGTCFSLTTTGGCLLVALVFGHFNHAGPVSIMPKAQTLKIFKELGLIFFLTGAGVSGGEKFVSLFKPEYFVYGMFITVIPMIIGFIFAKYVLKLSLLNNLGSLTGAMTSTPALGTLIGVAKTDDVAAAYAATYPIALITVVLISQVIVILF